VELADTMERFGRYGNRFSAALRRVVAGNVDAFTKPRSGSYHDVWMELHQHLLFTLDRQRIDADGH
jgi:hypothetical protein